MPYSNSCCDLVQSLEFSNTVYLKLIYKYVLPKAKLNTAFKQFPEATDFCYTLVYDHNQNHS